MPIRRSILLSALLAAVLAGACTLPGAGLAASFLTGLGDEQASMFESPAYRQLGTRIARDIVPYDVADRPEDLAAFRLWYSGARAAGVAPLVAFYHSRVSPLRLPSVAGYRREIAKFMRMFPAITSYQPWNEANRGFVRGQFKSPSAGTSAKYYLALKALCRHCQVVGLDVLDGASIKPTISYIRQFQRALAAAHKSQPTIWGLHNYSDTNRFRSSGTKAVLRAVKGQVWLTETGGIVQFDPSFANPAGRGLARAAKALRYMFALAASNPRIKRLYIFQWTGSTAGVRFDAGLIGPEGSPRSGYFVVCQHLLGAHSSRCTPAGLPVSPAPTPTPGSPYGTPVAAKVPTTLPGGLTGSAALLPS
ncbi:MAG TPA: hypothetical protein VID29_01985 [Solirubrobacteraceae bacterium]